MASFLNKPAVQLTLFGAAVAAGAAYFFLKGNGPGNGAEAKPPPAGMGQAATEKVAVGRRDLKGSETTESVHLDKLVLPPLKPEPPTLVKEPEKPKEKEKPKSLVFPELVQARSAETIKPFKPELPEVFAPRGTLIKAALVITLESNAVGTPVLAMVTEDVYFQGKLIVPAGTQVQASASSTGQSASGSTNTRFRDRIDIRGNFTFIWADGSEYVMRGIALDHEPLSDGTFSLTDGSPGIKGRILKTDEYAELKLMISEAVQSYAKTQQSSFNSIYGFIPGFGNKQQDTQLGAGIGAASAYSSLLMNKIDKDLEYVQVPAGTSFYIFTLDVFEPELRSVGAIRQGNTAKSGLELQKDSYSQMVNAAVQSANEVKAQLEDSKSIQSAARQQSLIDRAQALIAPFPAGSAVRPATTPDTNRP